MAVVLFLAIGSFVLAAVPGDFDDDGDVDLADFLAFEACLSDPESGQAPFVEECRAFDFDGDDDVDLADFVGFQGAYTGSGPAGPPPTLISGTSPTNGEAGVAITRETIVFFSAPIDAATVNESNFFAMFAGAVLPARVHVSKDGRKATLFYVPDHLPASARVRVTFDGDGVLDLEGRPIDPDGDGASGGLLELDFDTLTLTAISGTNVCGRVCASELADNGVNVPLDGVTITVDGMDELSAVTDAMGNFCLEDAPVGRFFVHIDGRTTTNTPEGFFFPFVGKAWESRLGETVNLGTIHLPAVADQTLQAVSVEADTEIAIVPTQLANIADPDLQEALRGVRLTVPAGSLMTDDGADGSMVGLAPVPPDRLPGPLPDGLDFPIVITVQTDGATNFDVPAPVCFPNLPDPTTGEPLPPNAKSALWSFNHDTGRFEVVGPMTVTADGELVCTDPGVGILAPGWHAPRRASRADGNASPPTPPAGLFDTPFDAKLPVNQTSPGQELKDNLPVGVTKKSVGVKVDKLIPELFVALMEVEAAYKRAGTGFTPFVSSGNDSKHGDDSAHYRDAAIDLSSLSTDRKSRMTEAQAIAIAEEICNCTLFKTPTAKDPGRLQGDWDLSGDGKRDFFILVEKPGVKGGQHIHIQFKPRDLCFMCNDASENAVARADAGVAAATGDERLLVSGGPYFLAFEAQGTVQRIVTNGSGTYSLMVPPDTEGTAHLYDPVSKLVKHTRVFTAPNGRTTDLFQQTFADWQPYLDEMEPCEPLDESEDFCFAEIPIGPPLWDVSRRPDSDGDTLPDDVEFIIGTAPDDPDSDDDGISDGAEVEQGTNPLDGLVVRTGLIATADTPGTAVDVCALNDIAIVADSDRGISVFNVFNGMAPLIIAQVDTPGTAQRVACSGRRIAVADGSAGLAVIDVADPPAARIVHQVPIGGTAQAVAVAADVAYVGSSTGQVAVVDMIGGSVLGRIEVPGNVQDVSLGEDVLYVLTTEALHAVPLLLGELEVAGSVDSPFVAGPNRRLFVGEGIAYAVHGSGANTFSLADPLNPTLIAAATTDQNGWKQIALNGSGLGIAAVGPNPRFSGPNNVSLYDVTDPAQTDVFLAEFETPGVARALSIFNGLAYVADHTAGLQVVNFLPYDALEMPPTIELDTSFLRDPARAEEGQLARVTARVTDDVQVRNVEFFIDGQSVVTDGNFPFEHRFTVPRLSEQSSFTVRAVATDTGGNTTESTQLVVAVVPDATPPRVTRVSPADGIRLGGATTVAVFLSEPIDPGTLNVTTFLLTEAGPDEMFDTPDDTAITTGLFEYNDTVQASFLRFSGTLPFGEYRVTVSTAVTDLAGNGFAEPFTSHFKLAELPVVAARGTPTDAFVASANIGQTFIIEGMALTDASRVLFATRGSGGGEGEVTVGLTDLSPDGDFGTVAVPLNTTTGDILLPDGEMLRLQIVPVVTTITGGRGRVTTLIGSGFIEAATTVRFGNVEVADGGSAADDGIDVFARNARLNVTVPLEGALPYEVITAGGSSGRLSDVTNIPSTAETGTPADAFSASANVGQSVTLVGNDFVEGVTRVTVEAMDTNGVPFIFTVTPDSVSSDGRSLVFTVPLDARAGMASIMSGGRGFPFQIVPRITTIDGGRGRRTTLIGSGFIEGFTTVRFGGVEVTDTGPAADDGIDVFARNARLLVDVPLDGTLPYEVITEGGSSGRLSDVTNIPSTAETGTPEDAFSASANVGQSVTLVGNDFVEGVTRVTVEAMATNGVPFIVTVAADSVAPDGRSLVFTVPLDARTGTATTLSGGGGRFLQIVPALSIAPPVVPGAVVTLFGSGFIEGFTAVRFGAVQVMDTGPLADDGVDVFARNARLIVTVPPGGSYPVTVITQGGSSNAVFP